MEREIIVKKLPASAKGGWIDRYLTLKKTRNLSCSQIGYHLFGNRVASKNELK